MKSPLEVIQSFPSHNFTLVDAFESRLSVKQDEPFIMQGDVTLSWLDFQGLYLRLSDVLHNRGVLKGMRVAVMARNDIAHVLTLFALARLGAIMVPINPDFGQRETAYILTHADVCGVICDETALDVVQLVHPSLPAKPWLMTVKPTRPDITDLQTALAQLNQVSVGAQGQADDICIIIYTSGTTGFPKGVMHSQINLLRAGEANVERLHLQPQDRYLIILPFFHVNAVFYSLSGVLASGSCMILVPKFSASVFWETAAQTGATVVNLIEAIGTILCNRDRSEYRPDHKIRAAYGVRKASADVFRKDFGIDKLMSGFGMTEIPGVTCNPWEGPSKPGSMGVVGRHPDPSVPWAQCRVVDEQGLDVGVDETGELWVKTPIVMQGYFRDPQQTAQAFEQGWLKTGDLVRVDADGFYYHLSRKKDIIRRRGENIAAAELEMVIAEIPGVYQVAAVAVPSELGEDDIMVVIVLKAGATVSAESVRQWCADRLAAIKVPRYVAFIEQMPLTPTHKISKAELRSDKTIVSQAVDFQAKK